MKQKTIIITIILIILSSSFVLSEEITGIGDIKNTIIKENRQTRAELKEYIDTKNDKLKQEVTRDAQGFIDKNFAILDNQIHKLGTEMLIRAVIGIITAILFSQIVWYIIKNSLERIKGRKRKLQG